MVKLQKSRRKRNLTDNQSEDGSLATGSRGSNSCVVLSEKGAGKLSLELPHLLDAVGSAKGVRVNGKHKAHTGTLPPYAVSFRDS